MKKLFFTLFLFLGLSPISFAQFNRSLPGPEILIQAMKEYISDPNLVEPVYFTERIVNGQYATKEENKLLMSPEEYMEYYQKQPIISEPETKITNRYKEAIISIPKSAKLYDVEIGTNKETGEPYLFLTKDLISISIDQRDIYFHLDYEVYPAKRYQKEFKQRFQDQDYNFNDRPLKVKIKYDPKYFTLKKLTDYETAKKIKFFYNGTIVELNTVTQPVLYAQDKEGNDVYFVLEPNFQNIYKDFKFVREGHKEVQFIDL